MTYGQAPWIFEGKALYQLSLVPTDIAKQYIPQELHSRIVELFGHTLGGLYLAQYEDSPVGAFDELVVLGGLIWNPPTSCAWASRVYVNNKEARDHGLHSVGLPSRLADFTLQPAKSVKASNITQIWQGNSKQGTSSILCISNVERCSRGLRGKPVCTLQLPFEWSKGTRLGPRIKLSLPSFSGGTLECPHLLKYSCDLQTNVMILPPAIILGSDSGDEKKGYDKKNGYDLEDLSLVLGGKPIVTLAFDRMKMRVDEPSKLVLEMTSKGSRSKQLIQH